MLTVYRWVCQVDDLGLSMHTEEMLFLGGCGWLLGVPPKLVCERSNSEVIACASCIRACMQAMLRLCISYGLQQLFE